MQQEETMYGGHARRLGLRPAGWAAGIVSTPFRP